MTSERSRTESTCWTLIADAAKDLGASRELFSARYANAIRAYLGARWRNSPLSTEVDDAAQEVFYECFREGGVLESVEQGKGSGFRAYLYGVARNVALRAERRRRRPDADAGISFDFEALADNEPDAALAFDRAWAHAVVTEAAELQATRAAELGKDAERRVEILRLLFGEGLPAREVARRFGVDAPTIHRERRRARSEYLEALREVVGFHFPGRAPGEIDRECARINELLE